AAAVKSRNPLSVPPARKPCCVGISGAEPPSESERGVHPRVRPYRSDLLVRQPAGANIANTSAGSNIAGEFSLIERQKLLCLDRIYPRGAAIQRRDICMIGAAVRRACHLV